MEGDAEPHPKPRSYICLLLISMMVGLIIGLINGLSGGNRLRYMRCCPRWQLMYIARGLGLWIAGVSQGAVVSTYSVIINTQNFSGYRIMYTSCIRTGFAMAQVFLSRKR